MSPSLQKRDVTCVNDGEPDQTQSVEMGESADRTLRLVSAGSADSELSVSIDRSFYNRIGKRLFDVVVASLLLFITSPVMILVAVGVLLRLGSGGVVFRQRRVGRGGQSFTIYKFRSMLPDRRRSTTTYIGEERRTAHKSANDPRHRRFGRFIRATSLDELPQLVNVIRGDMSLVGPRPELESIVRAQGNYDHPRHLVRPGITGAFQVSALRTDGDLEPGFDMDVDYAFTIRFRTDCRYLVQTLKVPFGGTGK